MHISCTVFELASYLSKVADFIDVKKRFCHVFTFFDVFLIFPTFSKIKKNVENLRSACASCNQLLPYRPTSHISIVATNAVRITNTLTVYKSYNDL